MTLRELKEFAEWLVFEADIQRNESCNCHPEYSPQKELVEKAAEKWWEDYEKI